MDRPDENDAILGDGHITGILHHAAALELAPGNTAETLRLVRDVKVLASKYKQLKQRYFDVLVKLDDTGHNGRHRT